ncbi:MAG: hypothetical protein HQ567_25625, partial [Candidatus Nealsonbacteria bacterium]|nr:hypothetical protein [Candidatus Nealsonbacteria bacterium]
MVCQCSIPDVRPQPDIKVVPDNPPGPAIPLCPAKAITPPERQQLAIQALAGTETVSRLAGEHSVSRKFVYQQTARAEEALDAAFSP